MTTKTKRLAGSLWRAFFICAGVVRHRPSLILYCPTNTNMKILTAEIAAGPAHLTDLIHQFVAKYPKLRTPDGAVGRCKFASYELSLYLRQRSINARVIHLQGCRTGLYNSPHAVWRDKSPAKWSHYVVGLGRWSLDVTARQFDASVGVPHIVTLTTLRSDWSTVEQDRLINNWITDSLRVR